MVSKSLAHRMGIAMNRIVLILVGLIVLPLAAAENSDAPKIETSTCLNYDKPQDVHPTHYWDGKIPLRSNAARN